MSKKQNKSAKLKSGKRTLYAQKHPRTKKATSLSQKTKGDVPEIIMTIILIIAIVALLLCLIQGGGNTYDYYPGMPSWLSK